MTPGLLTAGSGQSWENDLVAALARPGSGMTVIRRCVDVADVLTAATTGQACVVLLSAELRRLDSEVVHRLAAAGVAVVGVYPAEEERVKGRLERIGLSNLIADDVGVAALLVAARAAVLRLAGGPPDALPADRTIADPRSALRPAGRTPDVALPPGVVADPPPLGRVVAVWGPGGAPGRTTVAGNLAVESAAAGVSTLLVDADVYGGVLAGAFGLLDESPGLAGACRQAANRRLEIAELTRLVWAVAPDLRLLTGITRADRWPELRPSAIPAVLAVCRSMAALTVVDCGFSLEADEEITFDTVAPRRNGATLAVLADADVVFAVGSADPPGMERLIRGLTELREMVPECEPRVVLNRSRRSAATPEESAAALARFTGLPVTASLPEDRVGTDRAWQLGVPLAEAAPTSPLRKAIKALAGSLLPVGSTGAGGSGARSAPPVAVPR